MSKRYRFLSSRAGKNEVVRHRSARTQNFLWSLLTFFGGSAFLISTALGFFLCNQVPLFTSPTAECVRVSGSALGTIIGWIYSGQLIGFGLLLTRFCSGVLKITLKRSLSPGEQAVEFTSED